MEPVSCQYSLKIKLFKLLVKVSFSLLVLIIDQFEKNIHRNHNSSSLASYEFRAEKL